MRWCDFIIFFVTIFYVFIAPFTKVEESFFVQSIHDFSFYGLNLERFDHVEFPGVVPRSGIPSFFFGIFGFLLRYPIELLIRDQKSLNIEHALSRIPSEISTPSLFGANPVNSKLVLFISLRILMSFIFSYLLSRLRSSVELVLQSSIAIRSISELPDPQPQYLFGNFFIFHEDFDKSKRLISFRIAWTLLFISQFHLLFYASRPLANTFSLYVFLFCLENWIKSNIILSSWRRAQACLIFIGVVLRFDIFPLFILFLFQGYVYGKQSNIRTILLDSFKFFLLSVLSTVLFDSWFWKLNPHFSENPLTSILNHTFKNFVWPEFSVLWFNTIMNKSHEWGTLPFWWYFRNAIPKVVLAHSVFFFGALFSKTRQMYSTLPWSHLSGIFWCFSGFLLIFSFVPHKELRFIFYVFPFFNVIFSLFLSIILTSKNKFWIFGVSASVFIVNFIILPVFIVASTFNYPGGVAASHMQYLPSETRVFIDNFACQTGFSRFLDTWTTTKEDGSLVDYLQYDFLVLSDSMPPQGFERISVIYSFSGISVDPPFLKLQPSLFFFIRLTKT